MSAEQEARALRRLHAAAAHTRAQADLAGEAVELLETKAGKFRAALDAVETSVDAARAERTAAEGRALEAEQAAAAADPAGVHTPTGDEPRADARPDAAGAKASTKMGG